MTTDNGAMRIIYLEAENIKRLKAVRIKPDKTLVRIEGRNAQGKSSVLDAIAAAVANNSEMDRLETFLAAQGAAVTKAQGTRGANAAQNQATIAQMEKEIERLRAQIVENARQLAVEVSLIEQQSDAVSAKLKAMKRIDVTGFAAEIANAETTNRMIREADGYKTRMMDVRVRRESAEAFDSAIAAIDAKKHDMLVNAKFPLPGLSVDANGPLLNGLPFSQASSSEQLRTSVAIAMAQKPKLRIMLIRDGSLLDGNGLNDLHKIAEEYDAQVFVERVSDVNSPSAVMIEDGEIVEAIANENP